MLDHPETEDSYQHSTCVHCNAIFKRKTNLDDHIVRKHPDFIASVSSKIHECTHCSYKSVMKANLDHHMLKHPETADSYKLMCSHCNATFKRKINLDEHILRKHPYFMTFVSSKIHECIYCMYKSTRNDNFVRHMLRHAEAADNYKLKTCIHCNTTFERKKHLDEHTVCEHPDFIASVSSKIHQCTRCTFKTVMKANLARHMLKHPDSSNLSRCIYCNATYKSKRNMDNHIIRKHKIHECKYCMYKTTVKAQFSEHMTQHYETADSYKLRCGQCDAIFRRKSSLDEHIVRKHPNSIASVSSKIHECTYCAYQTVIKPHFARHMLKHPETRCIHCNAIYKRKMSLDDHILRRHPEHIASVSNKIHECTHCAFKTVMKAQLAHHMLKHTGDKLTCTHCNSAFNRKLNLDDHIVRKHPHLIASVSSKIRECTQCTYKTTVKGSFDKHMLKHSVARITCAHCDAVYKRKEELDEHTIKKHPDAIASVSSKIYECPHCTYKTIIKRSFAGHMLEHPETDICSACIHCNAIFKQKSSLDDHIICKHPDFIASVSSKIHECTHCPYKTVVKSNLVHHNMLKHPETVDSNKFILCVHCNTAYSNKKNLDEHIIRIHPDCIASISSKVHQCGYCSFKTTVKGNFTSHMLNHSETADSFKLNRTCTDCNTTFKSKTYLDEHIIRKHPDFMASVSSKIHECSHCTYQSTIKRKLAIHLLKHG
nr:unnamed protein product [Callosobruchus chinensis]